jgi:hypothetical protein
MSELQRISAAKGNDVPFSSESLHHFSQKSTPFMIGNSLHSLPEETPQLSLKAVILAVSILLKKYITFRTMQLVV